MIMNTFSKKALKIICCTAVLFSCSKEENNTQANSVDNPYDTELNGDISTQELDTETLSESLKELISTTSTDNENFITNVTVQGTELTLDPTKTYHLTGAYVIKEGVTLNILAGTKIVAQKGVGVHIVVSKGAKLNILGELNNPVEIVSEEGNSGDWGGIVICGKAKTTLGEDIRTEVGGYYYGGSQDDDNSGTIQYLVLKGAGAKISQDRSEFNGLSLYAVGSGTSLSNIAIINSGDDGIAFFGGGVDATNIYIENAKDDAVDWTEGWSGTLSNTYVKHTQDFNQENQTYTALEAQGDNNNPKISNFTAVSTVANIGLQFKGNSGADINNLHLGGYTHQIIFTDQDDQELTDIPLNTVKVDGQSVTSDAQYTLSQENHVDYTSFGLGLE